MNPAVEYLESPDYMNAVLRGRYDPQVHSSVYEEATVLTCGGVTASRPMFELLEDHEAANNEGKCWMCKDD